MVKATDKDIYIDGYLKQNLDLAKEVIKKDWDMVFVVDGSEGCLSGDTEIQLSRGKLSRRYSLRWLYNHFNKNPDKIIPKNKMFDLKTPSFVRSFNGKEIRLHQMKTVTYSGMKKVYCLTLLNGKKIKATACHKFLTKNGWKELQYLVPGQDELMCDTLKAEKKKRKRIKLYDIQFKVDYHPASLGKKRIEVHRLIYEAHMNNLHFLDYLDILLNEPEMARKLRFIDAKKYHIHHIDGNHYNNDIKNLEIKEKGEHSLFHSCYQNFSQGMPKFSQVKSIEYVGIEDTYDVKCHLPHTNFVANGIIAHNSGKSMIAMQMAYYCDPTLTLDRVVFTPKDFRQAIVNSKPYQAVIYDEAYTGLSSRATMSLINRTLISMLAEIRQKNLFVFVVMPCFFDLDKYVALWRSRALIHVYIGDGFQRGYFCFFNSDRKKSLYMLGKRYYSYSKPAANFIGRFYNKYVVDEAEYKKKKRNSLIEREKKKEEASKKKEIEEEMFERMMAMDEKVPHKFKIQLLGIPSSTYFLKMKRWKEMKDLE